MFKLSKLAQAIMYLIRILEVTTLNKLTIQALYVIFLSLARRIITFFPELAPKAPPPPPVPFELASCDQPSHTIWS
jgi:hypothetical protein